MYDNRILSTCAHTDSLSAVYFKAESTVWKVEQANGVLSFRKFERRGALIAYIKTC